MNKEITKSGIRFQTECIKCGSTLPLNMNYSICDECLEAINDDVYTNDMLNDKLYRPIFDYMFAKGQVCQVKLIKKYFQIPPGEIIMVHIGVGENLIERGIAIKNDPFIVADYKFGDRK